MRYNVIAIEREYASGGREIGEKLAAKLNIPCYGQEILENAAAKMNLPLHELSTIEENVSSSLLYSLSMFANLAVGKPLDLSNEQKLILAESEIIKEISLNPCVIVGRGSAGLLRDKGSVLKVFVYADSEVRIKRAVEIYGFEPKQAESVLNRYDKRRTSYFKAATSLEWKNPGIYHMALNSGKLGIDAITDILYSASI